MSKSTQTYWNPLLSENTLRWKAVDAMVGVAEEMILAIDETNGDYTRLTSIEPGTDTSSFGPKSHHYPEEIMIIQGRLYDAAFDKWLEVGDYASQPPGEVHGPFNTDGGCVVLEMSFPSQVVDADLGKHDGML